MSKEDKLAQAASDARVERLATPTSWVAMSADLLRELANSDLQRPVPSVWLRDDGDILLYPGRVHRFYG